jgi:hypothetical protein
MGAKTPGKKNAGSQLHDSAEVSVTLTAGLCRGLLASLSGGAALKPQVAKVVAMRLLRATAMAARKKGKQKAAG